MDFNNFKVTRINIEKFKNLTNISLDLEAGLNILFGIEKSGKTSICEFIQFMLFGEESLKLAKSDAENIAGSLEAFSGSNSYVITKRASKEGIDFSFVSKKDNKKVETDLLPGEYLTGMNRSEFLSLSYFEQTRFGLPKAVIKEDFITKIAQRNKKTKYLNYIAIKEKINSYRNDEKTGILDKTEAEKELLLSSLNSRNSNFEELEKIKDEISQIDEKLEENEKRTVIIKADMSQYENDKIIDENIKNAQSIKNLIREKEKKLKFLEFELTNKIGKLSKENLESLKSDYNVLSSTISNQAEVRNELDIATESQAYHRRIYQGKPDYDFFAEINGKIAKYKKNITVWTIIGILLLILVPALYFTHEYFLSQFSKVLIYSGLGVIGFCGIASLLAAFILGYYKKISLKKANVLTQKELNDICDKMYAYEITKDIYSENIHEINEKYRIVTSQVDRITKKISKVLKDLGRETDNISIIDVCDDIIEQNLQYYDLLDEIETDKTECENILSKDLAKSQKKMSKEFLILQKELDFIIKQNDSLIKKKAILDNRSKQISVSMPDSEIIMQNLNKLEDESKAHYIRFNELSKELENLSREKDLFISTIKNDILNDINGLLKFFSQNENDKYTFDDQGELCFVENGTLIPLDRFGNGIAEAGILAFRFIIAGMMGYKKLPMIIDDVFDDKTSNIYISIIDRITHTSSQIILSTKSQKIFEEMGVSANCLAI